MSRRHLFLSLSLLCFVGGMSADPLSKKFDIDFFRDVPSRNLKGLATRSDGRLVAGPTLREIAAPAPAELLWCIEPTSDPSKFLLGTGPDGEIVEVTLSASYAGYTARTVAKFDDPQVLAVRQLPDGAILAGTSPHGAVYLVRGGKTVARVALPVDSIFDLLPTGPNFVLAATGNPGRVYRIDIRKLAMDGVGVGRITDSRALAAMGITLFGEIRDRNVRRIAAMPDGRIVAGSAPRGNIYVFSRDGGPPFILQENRDAEVTDLLPRPNGDLYASIVFSSTSGEARITPPTADHAPAPPRDQPNESSIPPVEVNRFSGRSTLVWFPKDGFPETLAARNGVAFYRFAPYRHTLVIAGGDAGAILGLDLKSRLSLTFPGSNSAQVNGILPLPARTGQFLLLRNNAPGLALLDFNAPGQREAETRKVDLATPARLGAIRLPRLRDVAPKALSIEARVSNGTDEIEGWSPWAPMNLDNDGGWRAHDLRGRYVELRIRVATAGTAAAAGSLEIDNAKLFALPQDRRPVLQDFRILSPGFGLVVAPPQPASPTTTLGDLLQGSPSDDDKRKSAFNNSQVVPDPGAQVVLWTVVDPDGDNIRCTFSIRRAGDPTWTDVVTDTTDSYAQFDTSDLPDGVYFTRLVASETSPRPPADRLSQIFETDDLVVDHTPPKILDAAAVRVGGSVVVTVHGRDALSLLQGVELNFNNGVHKTVEQPLDGILDGREETFELDVLLAQVSNASSVEVTLYDMAGNGASRRLSW